MADGPAVAGEKTQSSPITVEAEPLEKIEVVLGDGDGETVSQPPDLAKQLKDIQASETAAKQRAVAAEAARAQAVEQARRAFAEVQTARAAQAESESDNIANGIAAFKAEAEIAKQEIAAALAANDHGAVAAAYDKLAEAKSRLIALEAGKAELDRAKANPPPPVQQQQAPAYAPAPPPQTQIEQVLATLPSLVDSERQWIRQHPDALLDPANQQRLQVAYLDAQARGLARGSDEYFQFFNDRLGYQQEPVEENVPPKPATPSQQQQSSRRVAAPVSRTAPAVSGRGATPTRISLSREQQEAAKFSGVSNEEYARGVLRLQDEKARGRYSEPH